MRVRMLVYCACAVIVASTASAHGPQIQITVDTLNDNKITTRQMLPGNSYSTTNGLTLVTSIYVMPALPVAFLGQPVSRIQPLATQTFGPGLTYGYDQFVNPGGTHPFTANLNLHVEGLKIWDGSAFVPTGSGKEQLGMLASSSNVNPDTVKTTTSGADLPIAIEASYTADAHTSVRYTLLGDGLDPYAASRDGIYLATLQLSGTQASPGLTASSPFYYILNKNVALGELKSVVDSFAASQGIDLSLIQYAPATIPEPSAALLAMMGWIGLISCSQTRRRGWEGRGKR